ncbi:MAG: lytic transglycosylase domain-containing protein [Candidatus Aureabacteria bacterium]|nr:lytic transglycosylase domain-containing protein [Candidatus Auribacterota bacterium]
MKAKKLFSLPILTLVMISVICMVMVIYEAWRENRYAGLIKDSADRHGLAPLLVKAVIKRESNFYPRASGSKGEIGLMQVTPVVGREYAAAQGLRGLDTAHLFEPPVNIEVGCWYLGKAMRRYGSCADPVPFALAHYNAGASNVDRWMNAARARGDGRAFVKAITYPTTREYVRYILRRWRLYRLFSIF